MSSPITLDDIFALFRESEQQRKEYREESEQQRKEYREESEQQRKEYREESEQQRKEYREESEQQRKKHQQDLEEYKRAFKESQKAFEERQKAFEERQRIAEQEMEALRQQVERTGKQVEQTNKQVGGLTSRWGEFVENLIKPATPRIFREQGIDVHYTAMRVKGDDQRGSMEIDILVENGNEIVAIEVKSHLEIRNVKRFLEMLARFKEAFPKYQNYKLYGAVAGIKIDEKADEYATQQGLFVIEPAGDSVIIANSQNLERRIW